VFSLESKKNQLIDYIKEDINAILSGMNKKYPMFKDSISRTKENKVRLTLKYDSLKELIEEFCYKFKYLLKIDLNPKFQERLKLFSEVFFAKLGEVDFPFLHIWRSQESFGENTLFFQLFYSIFCTYIITEASIDSIFYDLFSQWINAIEKKKILVNIMISLPDITLPKESPLRTKGVYLINDNISINFGEHFYYLKKRGKNFPGSASYYSYLLIKSEISFDFYRTNKEHSEKFIENDEKFRTEWNSVLKGILEVICSFYMNNIEFKYQPLVVEFPWWFEPLYKEYRKLGKSNPLFSRVIPITQEILDKIAEFYPKLVKSELFSNKRFIILGHHYMQLYNRDFSPDMILDLFIIFEFIFTNDVPYEVTFRLSLNVALFLAKDLEEFERINKFFRKMYRIRSFLVHGANWMGLINKFVKNNENFDNIQDIIKELMKYANLSIKKLINLKASNPNIMSELKGTYFIKNSNLFKNHLT
jgi:hypothetical protein